MIGQHALLVSIISTGLTGLAAILAVTGETWYKNDSGKRRLTGLGASLVIVILLGSFASGLFAYISDRQGDQERKK